MLFKIGVVGENVNEILNHPVAEVVLLLEKKQAGKKKGVSVPPCADGVMSRTNRERCTWTFPAQRG